MRSVIYQSDNKVTLSVNWLFDRLREFLICKLLLSFIVFNLLATLFSCKFIVIGETCTPFLRELHINKVDQQSAFQCFILMWNSYRMYLWICKYETRIRHFVLNSFCLSFQRPYLTREVWISIKLTREVCNEIGSKIRSEIHREIYNEREVSTRKMWIYGGNPPEKCGF